jgi:hypothetical protein
MRPVVRASHRSRDHASGFGPALNSSSGRAVSGERCCRGSFHPVNPQLQGIFHGREQGFPLFCYFLQFDLYRISLVPFAARRHARLAPRSAFSPTRRQSFRAHEYRGTSGIDSVSNAGHAASSSRRSAG